MHLQAGLGAAGIGGAADQGNHLGQGIEGDDQAFNDLEPIFSPFQRITGAADDREFAIVEEMVQHLPQGQL